MLVYNKNNLLFNAKISHYQPLQQLTLSAEFGSSMWRRGCWCIYRCNKRIRLNISTRPVDYHNVTKGEKENKPRWFKIICTGTTVAFI